MNLSPEEIEELINSTSPPEDEEEQDVQGQTISEYTISDEDSDILGEVGNMCMGSVAHTMNIVLGRRVTITTPRVAVMTTADVLQLFQVPFIIVEVEYIEGISGKNLLMLKEPDAAMITDIMLGGEGKIDDFVELSEMHMSAVSEIMNQMIGASATTMSDIIGKLVNISPPIPRRVDGTVDVNGVIDCDEIVIMISFEMEIEGLLNSQLLQLMPYQIGIDLAAQMKKTLFAMEEAPPPPPPRKPEPAPEPPPEAAKPVLFPSFSEVAQNPGIELVQDIPIQVSVELGRTNREINEILKFNSGYIVELEKINGDPVDIYANGKLIARGTVVTVYGNYGVQITEIIGR